MYQAATQPASVDPIISRLRPRSVGEILDQAFRLYRRNFLTFLAIISVVVLPLQLAMQVLSLLLVGDLTNNSLLYSNNYSTESSAQLDQLFTYLGVVYAAIIVLFLVSTLIQSLSQGALTAEIANSHLDKPVSFGDGYRQMFSRLGPLIGSIFLQLGLGIAIFVPIILLFVLAIGIGVSSGNSSSGGSDGAFVGIFCFSCLLIVPAFLLFAYVFVRFYVVTPVVMVEHLGPAQALRRSWELIRNYWWRTFGLIIALGILSYIVQLGPSYLIQAIVGIFIPHDFIVQQVVSGLVAVFCTLVFIPVQLTAVTLYYFDLRVRKEGYDIETALTQRYAFAPQMPPAWAGAGYGQGYGQPNPTTPVMPPPSLGQDSYGQYGQYNQYGQYSNYGQSAPTQPTEQEPRSGADTGPLPSEDNPG